jgi:hypothetical protein
MRTRWWAIIAAGALLLFIGAYVGSAYQTTRLFAQAVRAGDATTLSAIVDFPAVRDSLKPQLTALASRRLDRSDDPLARLGSILAPVFVDRSVDAVVTPEGLSALVRGEQPFRAATGRPARPAKIAWTSSWRDIGHLKVQLRDGESGAAGPVLMFEHRGVFDWKLVSLTLPDNALRP